MIEFTLFLFGVGFAATLIASLLWRFASGMGLADLARTRCYEVMPLRGLIWLVWGLAWGVFLADLLAIGISLLGLFSSRRDGGDPLPVRENRCQFSFGPGKMN